MITVALIIWSYDDSGVKEMKIKNARTVGTNWSEWEGAIIFIFLWSNSKIVSFLKNNSDANHKVHSDRDCFSSRRRNDEPKMILPAAFFMIHSFNHLIFAVDVSLFLGIFTFCSSAYAVAKEAARKIIHSRIQTPTQSALFSRPRCRIFWGFVSPSYLWRHRELWRRTFCLLTIRVLRKIS